MQQSDRIKAQSQIQIDNQDVVVTEWRFAPFAETGWHKHSMAYIVVPQTSGRLLLETKNGKQESEQFSELTAGESYYRPAGIEHNVVNANEHEFVFIEIELKR
ncbi:cupin domain-containing protein [Aliamphritea ceti]|uniref:cupin domain-containing protein n=1 Tax=Aliamphritea ceti TaxID=1524258 RepID=UPI0021C25A67|nr:cupin domain-containing protein [Aliamphritea ceti]